MRSQSAWNVKQGLGARAASEGTKVLERGELLGMLRFLKSVPRVRVWDYERKGEALVEVNLGIKETDGFGFSQTESLKDFHGLLLQASIYTSIDAVRHSYLSSFSQIRSTPVVVRIKDDSLWYFVGRVG
jgi:hypothetical protein